MATFECLRCGACCHEYEFVEESPGNIPALPVKRIPVFPEELPPIEQFLRDNGIQMRFIEDVFFPDVLNKKIIVITYRVMLDEKTRGCPLYEPSEGCLVQEFKPIACRAYPIAARKIDAFHENIEVDPYCKFIEENPELMKELDLYRLKEIFPAELENARKLMGINQQIILKINLLSSEKKIFIPEAVPPEELNQYLSTWDRCYLSDFETLADPRF